VAIHGGQIASKHDHLERSSLNMFDGETQAVSYSRVTFPGSENDLVGLDEHLLSARAAKCDFPDLTCRGCLDVYALGSIDSQDSLQMTIGQNLEKAARLDDLFTQSQDLSFPIPEEGWSGFLVQGDGFDGQSQ
tara:strand:- start:8756 stop:9154 length:399 start_codon:yes stop_codon:yes gene_type:complete